MMFYEPKARCSTFTRAFKFRYWCPECDARPLIPTNAQMFRYGFFVLGGGVALGWLVLSQAARQFEHSKGANRSMVLAILYLFLGIASGYLLFLGSLNRFRYPLLRDLSKSSAGKSIHGAAKQTRDSVPGDC